MKTMGDECAQQLCYENPGHNQFLFLDLSQPLPTQTAKIMLSIWVRLVTGKWMWKGADKTNKRQLRNIKRRIYSEYPLYYQSQNNARGDDVYWSILSLLVTSVNQGFADGWLGKAENYQTMEAKPSCWWSTVRSRSACSQHGNFVDPNNPHGYQTKGRLLRWENYFRFKDAPVDDIAINHIIYWLKNLMLKQWPCVQRGRWHGQSLQVRARFKGYQHPDTQHAITMALTHGRYFTDVIRRVMPIFLSHYDDLSLGRLREFYDLLRQGLKANFRNEIINDAKGTRGHLGVLTGEK